jgi:hypothetical protein
MTDSKGDLEKRVDALEKSVADLWARCAAEAMAARLSLFPHADEAPAWRRKIDDIRARLRPAKQAGRRLKWPTKQ